MPRQNENNHAEIKFIIKRGDEVKILCPFHLETTVDANDGKLYSMNRASVDIVQVLSTQDDDWKNMFCDSCVAEGSEHKHMTVGDLVKKLQDYDSDAPVVINTSFTDPMWMALKVVDFTPHDPTHLMLAVDGDKPVME
jgi:hypothetical protein